MQRNEENVYERENTVNGTSCWQRANNQTAFIYKMVQIYFLLSWKKLKIYFFNLWFIFQIFVNRDPSDVGY